MVCTIAGVGCILPLVSVRSIGAIVCAYLPKVGQQSKDDFSWSKFFKSIKKKVALGFTVLTFSNLSLIMYHIFIASYEYK